MAEQRYMIDDMLDYLTDYKLPITKDSIEEARNAVTVGWHRTPEFVTTITEVNLESWTNDLSDLVDNMIKKLQLDEDKKFYETINKACTDWQVTSEQAVLEIPMITAAEWKEMPLG